MFPKSIEGEPGTDPSGEGPVTDSPGGKPVVDSTAEEAVTANRSRVFENNFIVWVSSSVCQ